MGPGLTAAAGRLVMLLAAVAAASILGAGEFGKVALLLASSQVLGIVATVGSSRALTRVVPLHRDQPLWLYLVWRASLSMTIAVAVLVSLALMVLPTDYIELFAPDDSLESVAILGIWTLGFAVGRIAQSYLIGHGQQAKSAVAIALRSLAVSVALVLGSLSGAALEAGAAAAAAELAVALAVAVYAHRVAQLLGRQMTRSPVEPPKMGVLWRNSLASLPTEIALPLMTLVPLQVLTVVSGDFEATGMFALAQRAFVACSIIPQSIARFVTPDLVSAARASAVEWKRVARINCLVSLATSTLCALVLAVMLWAYWAFGSMAGDVALLGMAMGVTGVIGGLASTLATMTQSRGLLRKWAAADVVSALSSGGAALLLIPSLALWGAYAAFTLGHALRAGLFALVLSRSMTFQEGGRT